MKEVLQKRKIKNKEEAFLLDYLKLERKVEMTLKMIKKQLNSVK